jgi:hypothetical protein
MKSIKRAIPFILLNILVSAATTLAVLNWFGGGLHFNQQPLPTIPPAVLNPTSPASQPTVPLATLAADASGRVIEITEVVGAGDLNNEAVKLKRVGDGDLQLAGWKLQDSNGHFYLFPDFILNKDGAVQLNTRAGANSAIALFWNEPQAVWTTGMTVTLYDPLGKLEAMFTIQ